MKPDRSNYEIWFTDLLDGKLGRQQTDMLKLFLDENPDLAEELEMMTEMVLQPAEQVFRDKEKLHKSFKELSESQFEQLCIAFLENDLPPALKYDLEEITRTDQERKKVFGLIQKVRLKPGEGEFSRKHLVRKPDPAKRIIQFSLIGLSAAATAAIILAVYLTAPSGVKDKTGPGSLTAKTDTLIIETSSPVNLAVGTLSGKSRSGIHVKTINTEKQADVQPASGGWLTDEELASPASDIKRSNEIIPVKVSAPNVMTSSDKTGTLLAAYNPPAVSLKPDEESKNYLAKFFHKKIKDTTSGNQPVKSYDIAVAGINGINRLLGWDMSLQRKTDQNGNVRSYYFSSRLIKINAPVKKPDKSL